MKTKTILLTIITILTLSFSQPYNSHFYAIEKQGQNYVSMSNHRNFLDAFPSMPAGSNDGNGH